MSKTPRTHCNSGLHEWTPDNIGLSLPRSLYCKACKRDRNKESYIRRFGEAPRKDRGLYGPRPETKHRVEDYLDLREQGVTTSETLRVLGCTAGALAKTMWREKFPVPRELKDIVNADRKARETVSKA